MKYVLLYRGGNPTEEQQSQNMQDWGAFIMDLTKRGVQKAGLPFKGGKVVTEEGVTDYQSADNDVAGYSEVEVESEDQAIEIAKMAPNVKLGGSVEVRAEMEMPEMEA